jgi:hypothetical protein
MPPPPPSPDVINKVNGSILHKRNLQIGVWALYFPLGIQYFIFSALPFQVEYKEVATPGGLKAVIG